MSPTETQNASTSQPSTAEVVSITKFVDQTTESTKVTTVVPPGFRGLPAPYADPGMKEVLSRLNKIGTFSWEGTNPAGQILKTIVFPQALASIAAVWDRMGRFSLFRAGIELQIKLNTIDFQSGALVLFHATDMSPTELADLTTNINDAFMFSPHIILANQATLTTIRLPYSNPNEWLKQAEIPTHPGTLATMAFAVVVPLSSSAENTTASVTVDLYARFVDPEVASPYSHKYTQPTLVDPKRRQLHVCKTLGDYSKSKFRVHSSEANAKTTAGSVLGAAERANPTGMSLTQIPIVGPLLSGVQDIASFLGLGGLNKPDSTAAPTFTLKDAARYDMPSNGLSRAAHTKLDLKAEIAEDEGVFGVEGTRNDSIVGMAMRPSLWGIYEISTTDEAGASIAKFPVGPFAPLGQTEEDNYAFPSWYHFAASHFQYWYGSTKYHFQFVSSKYLTGRVRISWMADELGDPESENGGEVYSAIVDVKGDTAFTVTVPWLNDRAALSTPAHFTQDAHATNGWIYVSLVNALVAYDSTQLNTMGLIITYAGDRDTLFSTPADTDDTAPPTMDKFRLHGDLASAFSQDFPPIVPATRVIPRRYTLGDPCTSWRAYLHRVRPKTTITQFETSGPFVFTPYLFTEMLDDMPAIYSRLRYMRGGYNIGMHTINGGNMLFRVAVTDGAVPGDKYQTLLRVLPTANGSPTDLLLTIPYASNAKWYYRTSATPALARHTWQSLRADVDAQTGVWLSLSVGDDFSIGQFYPPATLVSPITPPPARKTGAAQSKVQVC